MGSIFDNANPIPGSGIMSMPIDPYTGVPQPSDYAQAKFGRIVDALGAGLRNRIEYPGRVMEGGQTLDDMVNWATPTAMMMVGSPLTPSGALGSSAKVVDMQGWRTARELGAIRQNNLRGTFAENGGGIIKELPNKWSIGYRPGSSPDVNHVLLSPQGGPALYGRSPTDLIKRGFPDDEIPALLDYLQAR